MIAAMDLATAKARRDAAIRRGPIAPFVFVRPPEGVWLCTPTRGENDRVAASPSDIVVLKTWDRSPIIPGAFDPTQPPEYVPPPVCTAIPTLAGTSLRPGSVLTSTPGTWTNSPTLAHQWLNDGADIPGATNDSYTVAESDIGGHIAVRVTGSTTGGTSSAESAEVGPVPSASVRRGKGPLEGPANSDRALNTSPTL
jgi:hypothetical protein